MEEVEADAVLVGDVVHDGVRANGTAMLYRGQRFAVGDCVLMHHTETDASGQLLPPYIARIDAIWQELDTGGLMFSAKWFVRRSFLSASALVSMPAEDAANERLIYLLNRDADENPVEAIMRRCAVLYLDGSHSESDVATFLSSSDEAFVYRSCYDEDSASLIHDCEARGGDALREAVFARRHFGSGNPYLTGQFTWAAATEEVALLAAHMAPVSVEVGQLRLLQCIPTSHLRVECSSEAQLVMDFHAHLCREEVIGFLGGSSDAETGVVRVTRAYPCESLPSGDDSVQVEADPVAQFAVFERITGEGLQVVGWYHSHPLFEPSPSVRDTQNQLSQQTQFGAAFVGAIVASLDERLPFGVSVMNWFVARAEDDQEDGCVALSMACAAARDGEPDADAVLEGCRAAVRVTSRRARMRLDSLVKVLIPDVERFVTPNALNVAIGHAGQLLELPLRDKLRASLAQRVAPDAPLVARLVELFPRPREAAADKRKARTKVAASRKSARPPPPASSASVSSKASAPTRGSARKRAPAAALSESSSGPTDAEVKTVAQEFVRAGAAGLLLTQVCARLSGVAVARHVEAAVAVLVQRQLLIAPLNAGDAHRVSPGASSEDVLAATGLRAIVKPKRARPRGANEGSDAE